MGTLSTGEIMFTSGEANQDNKFLALAYYSGSMYIGGRIPVTNGNGNKLLGYKASLVMISSFDLSA
jgi:hypothetical protein